MSDREVRKKYRDLAKQILGGNQPDTEEGGEVTIVGEITPLEESISEYRDTVEDITMGDQLKMERLSAAYQKGELAKEVLVR